MSTYGKAPPSQIHGYGAGRTYSEASFPYTPSIYNQPSSGPPSTSAPSYQNVTQLASMAYSSNPVRTPYDEPAASYLNVGSSSNPEVTSFSPTRGPGNSRIYVNITSLYDLLTSDAPHVFLIFGTRKCLATLHKLSQQGAVCSYSVTGDAPMFTTTGWRTPQLPLSMVMETGDGDVLFKVDVGEFTYTDSAADSNISAQDVSKKRKASVDASDLMKSPVKRNSHQPLRPREEYGTYQYSRNETGPGYSPYMHNTNSYGAMPQPYDRPAGIFPGPAPIRQLQYGYTAPGAASSPSNKPHSPPLGNWNPYPNVISNLSRSPAIPSISNAPRPSISSAPSPAVSANPRLFRTSTLQQSPSPAATPQSGHPSQHYNAYSLYPHKAKLEINGDLDAMAQNWSDDEFDTRRRIVLFKRAQTGSTITTTFHPVGLEDRPQDSTCISCIYWEEKQECFVTSVEIIYLLEKLVDARFTVEEKNRIRRNLEGFRPLTVSKGKPDSEEFFKVIMAFPTPKPRNIEKDVKVFHWKDLSSALKKIIGKYSASPSSTLPPALLTPGSSTGYTNEGPSSGLAYPSDHHRPHSPQSLSSSSASAAYNPIPARALSPPNQTQTPKPKSMPIPMPMPMLQSGGPPDLRVSDSNGTTNHWQSAPHLMQTQQPHQTPQQPYHNPRNPWELGGYIDHNPGPATGTSSSGPAYPHSRNTSIAESNLPIARGLTTSQQISRA